MKISLEFFLLYLMFWQPLRVTQAQIRFTYSKFYFFSTLLHLRPLFTSDFDEGHPLKLLHRHDSPLKRSVVG